MKSVLDFQKAKHAIKHISMVTCYDYTSARIVADSNIDCILVGDSLAMTMHGHDTTLPATPELMAIHVAAVRKGAPAKFLIGDMPFLAHRGSLDRTMDAAALIMRAGAQAVKIEGIEGHEAVRHLVESGVPVMGHLGLTPQSVHQFGGFKVQSTGEHAGDILLQHARKLEASGVFALVLECVPNEVATHITAGLSIPTIGIGAGPGCSGQVLVFQDLLGLSRDFHPKFVRRYADGFELVKSALDRFDAEIKSGDFPNLSESY